MNHSAVLEVKILMECMYWANPGGTRARQFFYNSFVFLADLMVAQFSESLLRAASVAVTRSGNERAVKRAKLSWFIGRGMKHQCWDADFVCDVWEAWTFQINFMYEGFQ